MRRSKTLPGLESEPDGAAKSCCLWGVVMTALLLVDGAACGTMA
jgi:hypothetical protein